MRKRKKKLPYNETQISLFAQFLVIYGIMIGMALVSAIGLLAKNIPIVRSDLENIFINAFMPTTITIFATALFEYEFIKEDKMFSAAFIALMTAMSIFYIAFVYLETLKVSPGLISIVASLGISITAFSFVILVYKVSSQNRARTKRYNCFSDGHISAKRRK